MKSPVKLRYPTLIIILLLLVLIAIGGYMLRQQQTVTWSVSLAADWSAVGTDSAVRLTASTNHPVDGTPYFISIKDATTGAQIVACQQGTTCVGTVVHDQAASESFIAAVGNQAQSAPVAVAWRDWHLRLDADHTHVQAGARVTLTAHANQDVDFARYDLAILNESTGKTVKDCGAATTCTAVVSRPGSTRERFIAQVTDQGRVTVTSTPQVVLWDFSWQVALAANHAQVGTGSTVILTAMANHQVDGSPYAIRIEDARSGTVLATCKQGRLCQGSIARNQAQSEQFVAVIGTQARSAPVRVTWRDWSVHISSDRSRLDPGATVTLRAHIRNNTSSSSFALSIRNSGSGQVVKNCGAATTCTVRLAQGSDTDASFVAQVQVGNAYTASSAPLTVIWGHPVLIVPQNGGVNLQLLGVAFVDPLHGWAVGDGGTILHTADGGATWVSQSGGTSTPLLSVTFINAQSGWAVGDGGTILHTANGGTTWLPQSSGINEPLKSVVFVSPTSGWCLSVDGTILHTGDGGVTWSVQYSSITAYLSSLTFVDASHGWAVGPGGVILHTSDGGATWLPQTGRSSASLNAVAFSDARSGWIVGSDGTILHTSDGGTTWVAQHSGTGVELTGVRVTGPSQGWVVGYDGTILRTTDGGATWLPQASGTSEYLAAISFAGAHDGWAVGAIIQARGTPTRGPILHIAIL
jgi:photosystem II stability/assembly factor-like uncharacterized protein